MSKKSLQIDRNELLLSGSSTVYGRGPDDREVLLPRMSFYSRADLAAAKLPAATPGVYVERYTAGGPVVGMFYSLNSTDQSSVDPTSMAVSVYQSDGSAATKYTKLMNNRVTPAMMGAPLDGSADDAVAISRALTKFGCCFPDGPAQNYIIKSQILPPANSVFDFTGWKGLLKVDLSIFTNAVMTAGQYGSTGAVIKALGSTSGTDIPIDGFVIRGLRMTPIVFVEQRITNPICLINASNFLVEQNEIFGFCAGAAINLNSCPSGKVRDNNIHDWYSNYAWSVTSQPIITAITADNDRVHSGKTSTRVSVTDNKITSLTLGATAIAAIGYQTEGIDLLGSNANGYHVISRNIISTVDEAIATFSNHVEISNNIIDTVTYGLKLDHGASDCLLEGNVIDGVKGWSISITSHNDYPLARNKVRGNNVTMVGGAPGSNNACVYVADSVSYPVTDTVFEGNVFNTAGTVPYNIYSELTTGVVRSVNDHWVTAGSDATYPWIKATTDKKFFIERPVKRSRFKATLASDFTKDGTATEQFLTFSTISEDARSEYVAGGTNAPVVHMPGFYRIVLQLGSVTWPTANRANIGIYSYDGSTVQRLRGFFNPANAGGSPVFVAEHVYFPKANTKITVGLAFASGSTATILGVNEYDTYLAIEKE